MTVIARSACLASLLMVFGCNSGEPERALSGSRERVADANKVLCGHWCVLRSCEVLGVPVNLSEIVGLLPGDRGYNSMKEIVEVLEKIGLRASAKKIADLASIAGENAPIIAHLKDPDHFVVVCSCDDRGVHIFDDFGHQIVWSKTDFLKRWTGKVVFVSRDPQVAALPKTVKSKPGSPRIQFDVLYQYAGSVPFVGRPVPFQFRFRNVGDSPLTIGDVAVSCKCLSAEAPEKAIAPGESGVIDLDFDVGTTRGSFVQDAVVRTNDPTLPVVQLKAAGYVYRGIELVPSYVDFGEVNPGGEHVQHIFLRYTGDWDKFKIRSVESTDPQFAVDHFRLEPDIAEEDLRQLFPDYSGTLRIRDTTEVIRVKCLPRTEGSVRAEVTVRTNVDQFEEMTATLDAVVRSQIQPFPALLVFTDDEDSARTTFVSRTASPIEFVSSTGDFSSVKTIESAENKGGRSSVTVEWQCGDETDMSEDVLVRLRDLKAGREFELTLPMRQVNVKAKPEKHNVESTQNR